MKKEYVILVDENDEPLGTAEKLAAHEQGQLHRAFSVFVFFKMQDTVQLLLQQRQHDKYHCGGLWSNSCCSHPRADETIIAAGERRLQEELGIHVPLQKAGAFHYIAHFDNGLTENEYDHVLVGFTEEKATPFNDNEVAAVQWIALDTLHADLSAQPEHYTPWFKEALGIAEGSIAAKY